MPRGDHKRKKRRRYDVWVQLRYAQLVPPGRTSDRVTGELDSNRPFRVLGEFTDEELVGLVTFVRGTPKWAQGEARDQVRSDWPVTLVNREADGSIVAALSENTWQGQRVMLRRTADGWTIVGVRFWIV